MARDPYGREIPQVPLQQQRQNNPPYLSTPQTFREPEPVLTQLGQPRNQSFVVSNFDARPLNGYDGFCSLACIGSTALAIDSPGDELLVPSGYTIIIRQLRILLTPETTVGGPFIFDIWGNPNANIHWAYQILLNGQPAPQISTHQRILPANNELFTGSYQILYAIQTPIDIDTYIVVPENTSVQTITRFDRANNPAAWTGSWNTVTHMSVNVLQNTGVNTNEEPVNKVPIPVSVTP